MVSLPAADSFSGAVHGAGQPGEDSCQDQAFHRLSSAVRAGQDGPRPAASAGPATAAGLAELAPRAARPRAEDKAILAQGVQIAAHHGQEPLDLGDVRLVMVVSGLKRMEHTAAQQTVPHVREEQPARDKNGNIIMLPPARVSWEIQLGGIDLDPKFADRDFTISQSIRNGTTIYMEDARDQSWVWRDGQVAAARLGIEAGAKAVRAKRRMGAGRRAFEGETGRQACAGLSWRPGMRNVPGPGTVPQEQ